MTVVADVMPKATVSALLVEKVSHAYGARIALDEVSFDVAPASFTVLLGLNGAGKSTLFSVITHLYVSRSGAVRIFGRDVARNSGAALAQLGVMFFASSALYPLWRVQEGSPWLATVRRLNPFTYSVELIRFAFYEQVNWLALAVVAGCTAAFLGAAVIAYDPARGMLMRRGG
jgi:ABC-type uncharacterized transport system ATPase subunit